MGLNILYYVQNIWPFSSVFKNSDLRESDSIVSKLGIPEHTKRFVFAIREPENDAVIYILCAQNLSERSNVDVECLIREIRPQAVIAQLGDESLNEVFESKDDECGDGGGDGTVVNSSVNAVKRFFVQRIGKEINDSLPTSSFEVLKRCFLHKINREKYESMAGGLVLKEIFGVGWNKHFVTAKRVAEEVGSTFMLLESPIVKCNDSGNSCDEVEVEVESGKGFQGLAFRPTSLVSQKVGSFAMLSGRRFFLTNDIQVQMVKSLSSYVVHPSSAPEASSADIHPESDYEPPEFAHSIYPLLVDLHKVFVDIPSIGRGLAHAQKMLYDVNRGEIVNSQLLSEVYIFRIAVEALRIALNNAGRLPVEKIKYPNRAHTAFSDLPVEDRSHALLAHALKSQTEKFKSVVAVIDSGALSGMRKHWNTPVPAEVKDMVAQLVGDCKYDDENNNGVGKRRLLTDKPVVAVGAGATAVLGASSLSKVVHASAYMKTVPASLKLMVTQTQKVFAMVLSKTLGPSNLVHAFTGSGVKTSALKATVSAEKIRAVTHSLITSAEKTSFSAMRAAFYEIMRKRRVKSIGLLPWVTFGGSVVTCTGLIMCGDGIECAVESFPSAPSIACLGRGIQNLRLAAHTAAEAQSSKIQKSIDSLLYRFKR
ncbi:TraB domain-containing protein [Heracleum sosnowskyi]|uniref:TraB domain-containing protein n=1 Tax=Heracleum sosnowskyi TaxID=360622 RepID=A0AAD8MTC6_9APIA|nr:TraB domain-containing protein [Heracleum sosnowskyi]